MRVLGITLEDYGAYYGVHEFPCADRGLTMVLGDNLDEPRMNSNGSAKSTLFEALDWCWYGKVPKGDHADSIINEEAKGCAVTTFLEDDHGIPAAIKRSRPSKLQFWLNGEEQTFLDTDKTQEAVEKFLGMDRDVCHASVFFGQNDLLHFADVGDAQRIKTLSKIIPELAQVDVLLEKAKTYRDGIKDDVEERRRVLVGLQGQLQGLDSVDYSVQQSEWEARRQEDLIAIQNRLTELTAYITEHEPTLARLPNIEAEVAKLTSEGIPCPKGDATSLWAAEQLVIQLHGAHSIAQASVTRIRDAIQKMSTKASGTCDRCGQEVTAEHLAQETARLQADLNVATRLAEQAHQHWLDSQGPVGKLKEEQARLEADWRAAEETRIQKLREANALLSHTQQLQNYVSDSRRQRTDFEVQLSNAQKAVNPFLEETKNLETKKEALLSETQKAAEAVDASVESLEYAEYWVKAFGPKGIKNYILDSKLQEMTDAANHWCKVLTGGTFWIRFETQKKGRSGKKKLSNELNIRVFRYNPDGRISDRNYKSWSGGEKKRVSLAIDFGLSRLVAKRATKKYDLLILDELFKHVDSAGGEAIAEMLEELKTEKSSIFVIEHDPNFQARFENRVLARRKNARSTIVELDNDQEPERASSLPSDGQTTPRRTKRPPKRRAKKKPKRTPVSRRVQS